jgi:hypothetical protein
MKDVGDIVAPDVTGEMERRSPALKNAEELLKEWRIR